MIMRLGGTSHFWNILEPLGYSRVESEGFVSSTQFFFKYGVWWGLTQIPWHFTGFHLYFKGTYILFEKVYTPLAETPETRSSVARDHPF